MRNYLVSIASLIFLLSFFFTSKALSNPQKYPQPKPSNAHTKHLLSNAFKSILALPSIAHAVSSNTGIASSDRNSRKQYKKPLLNLLSEDFWYPPYMIGRWNTSLTFSNANFTPNVPIEELARNNELPGFTKYSVIFAPDMGKNVSFIMRYAQIDSHPREDHPFNLRQRVQAFLPETVVDSAPYPFQV